MRVGILIFPEVEILDVAAPSEVFSVATRPAGCDGDKAAHSVSEISR